jgi:hypothetical protein
MNMGIISKIKKFFSKPIPSFVDSCESKLEDTIFRGVKPAINIESLVFEDNIFRTRTLLEYILDEVLLYKNSVKAHIETEKTAKITIKNLQKIQKYGLVAEIIEKIEKESKTEFIIKNSLNLESSCLNVICSGDFDMLYRINRMKNFFTLHEQFVTVRPMVGHGDLLICIETNPGPNSYLYSLFEAHRDGVLRIAAIVADPMTALHPRYEMDEGVSDLAGPDVPQFICLPACRFQYTKSMLHYIIHNYLAMFICGQIGYFISILGLWWWLEALLSTPFQMFAVNCFVNNFRACYRVFQDSLFHEEIEYFFKNIPRIEYLVGIEPNPGPPVNSTMAYIQRSIKYEERYASDSSARRQCNRSKYNDLAGKAHSKNRTLDRKRARAQKYEAEGFFDLSISDDAAKILYDLADKLCNTQHTLKFDLGITEILEYITEAKNKLSGFLKDFLDYMKTAIMEILIKFGMKFTNDDDDLQDSEEYFDAEGGFERILTLVAYRKYLNKYIEERDYKSLLDIFIKSSVTAEGVSENLSYLLDLFKNIINFIVVSCGYSPLFEVHFSADEKINSFYKRYVELKDDFVNSDKRDEYGFAQSVYLLYEELENYAVNGNVRGSTKERLNVIIQGMRTLYNYSEANINPNNGPRVEPLGVLIAGPSGSGKSTATVPLLLSVLGSILDKSVIPAYIENHNDFIHFRANENVYWDGVKRSHVACVFDDFGQRRDTASVPNPDAFECIRLINTAPFHLHHSAVSEKSKHYAQMKLVYATTNRKQLHFESIVSDEAVVRRFKIAYVQVPKVEFVVKDTDLWKRKLDTEKVREAFPYVADAPETYFPMDVYEYHPWDFVQAAPAPGKVLDFNELRQKILDLYNEQADGGSRMLRFHRHIKEKFIPEGFQDVVSQFDKAIFGDKTSPKLNKTILTVLGLTLASLSLVYKSYSGSATAESFSKKAKSGETTKVTNKGPQPLKKPDLNTSDINNRPVTKKSAAPRKGNRTQMARRNASDKRMAYLNGYEPHSGAPMDLSREMSIVKRNVYRIFIDGDAIGLVTFIKGHVFIQPSHFDTFIFSIYGEKFGPDSKEACIVDFVPMCADRVAFSIDWNDPNITIMGSGKTDLTFVKLPAYYCRSHKDITSAFAPSSMFKVGNSYRGKLTHLNDGYVSVQHSDIKIGDNVSYTVGETEFESGLLQYRAATIKGDCGGLITSSDGRFDATKILGFHVVGAASLSIPFMSERGVKNCAGVALPLEVINNALSFLYDDDEFVITDEIEPEFTAESTTPFNVLRSDKKVLGNGKSKLVPSPLHGMLWDITTQPAMLKPFDGPDGETINPRLKARDKYSHDAYYVSPDLLDRATIIARQFINNNVATAPWYPRIFSLEEAIDGVAGQDFVNAVDRNTSPGYPYSLDNKSQGKKYWLGPVGSASSAPGYTALVADINNLIDKAKKGVRTEVVYVDCLKDERRPIEKVLMGKTRQFMACPQHYLIAFKMYFGDFIRHVMDNRIFNGVAVGINPYTEWGTLATYLKKRDDFKMTAGDYSSYDCKIRTGVHFKCLEIIEQYYYNSNDEDRKVRRVMYEDVINSLHLNGGEVYEFNGGMASGNPGTAPLNSIANLIMICSVIADREEYINSLGIDLRDISKYVSLITFGDDNIIGYDPVLKEVLGQHSMGLAIKKIFDMDYTIETKDGRDVTDRDITEVNFLKRGFIIDKDYSPGNYVPPLDIGVLKETLNWERTSGTPDEFKQRIEAVLFELSLHGRKTFDECFPKINIAAREQLNYFVAGCSFELAREMGVGLNE